jgi:hypothetical protein
MPRTAKSLHRIAAIMVVMPSLLTVETADGATPQPPEFVPGSWTLVVPPDTQHYSEQYPGLFALQTHWIAKGWKKVPGTVVLGTSRCRTLLTVRMTQTRRRTFGQRP